MTFIFRFLKRFQSPHLFSLRELVLKCKYWHFALVSSWHNTFIGINYQVKSCKCTFSKLLNVSKYLTMETKCLSKVQRYALSLWLKSCCSLCNICSSHTDSKYQFCNFKDNSRSIKDVDWLFGYLSNRSEYCIFVNANHLTYRKVMIYYRSYLEKLIYVDRKSNYFYYESDRNYTFY